MNCMRVYLHHLVWETDKEGFKKRINEYLTIADKHHISTIFVFLDDCWNPVYQAGKQPEPQPGVHNSGWARDPGDLYYKGDPAVILPVLENYVKDILTTFKDDKRIVLWDLYNEPGGSGGYRYGERSLPFPFLIVLRSTFSSILFSPCATACAFSCASKLIVMLINTKYIIYLIDFISQHIYEKKVIFFNQLFFLSTINTSTINNNNAIHASP